MVTATPKIGQFPLEVQDYFPFEPRPGQSLMANEIYYGVLANNHVAIEGAAGMGKTVTCLSSLLPICKREGCTLLYTARTHTQIQRVIEELSMIYKIKGRHELTGISVYGRANMCLNPEVQGAPPVEAMEICGELRKTRRCRWYEELKSKEIDRMSGCFTSEYVREYGLEAEVCPYYLSKELMKHCNVIALTYVYLINPFMRSILFKTLDTSLESCVLVFDECHNLPDLAMHTMSLGVSDRGLKRALKEYHRYDAAGKYPLILKFLKHFKGYLDQVQQEYGAHPEEIEIGVDLQAFIPYLATFTKQNGAKDLFVLAREIKQFGRHIRRLKLEAKQSTYSSVYHFGTFLEQFISTVKDSQYLHYMILAKDRIQYYIRCIDCRGLLRPLQRARSIISMSGTLEPIDAYLDICGFPQHTRRRVLPSPFSHKLVRVFAMRGIDLTYFSRTTPQYQILAKRCLEVIRATPGNTAVFCASYDVLESFLKKTEFRRGIKDLGRPFYSERRDFTSRQNQEMITKFKTKGHQGKKAVLVGVCGGRNSEGVDFPGPEMITVIILGIPLARMTHSVNALITYYTEQFGVYKGKEYAYTLPALRRANQAAGRPIRTLRDYGVIVLLDDRYSHAYYRRFLSHWINENMVILNDQDGVLEGEVARFYLSQQNHENNIKGGF
ncbi:MAG: hypothetical protein HWN66_17395 [Candidatus Helarchaeota archaeon]|nr:hypothetical protein [Candidatus Helarchaeota archaeon]